MKKIENQEKIDSITFTRNVQPFCPLGDDYYTAEVQVTFMPNQFYPDYIELDKAIQDLGGKSLTIEQLAEKVFDIMQEFEPETLLVTITADSNRHFPVTVSKVY